MNQWIERWWRIVGGERRGAADLLIWSILRLISSVYRLILGVRAACYAAGVLRTGRLPRPVVSVGNLTLGGTGKTPTVIFVSRLLQGMGKRVCILTRGYGGSREGETAVVSDGGAPLMEPAACGDEPYLLATTLPGVSVVMGSDRYRAGMVAMEKLQPDVFVMDDGFQHRRLHRDLDILLIDASDPFGNGRLFPAGPLREPLACAGRADLVLLTRFAGNTPTLPRSLDGTPVIRSSHRLTGFSPLGGGELHPFSRLEGKRGIAFAGIARPERFFDMLEAHGVSLAATVTFPDHSPYGVDELTALATLKSDKRADFLITTAKDEVKLLPYRQVLVHCLVARLDLVVIDPGPLRESLERLLTKEGT